MVSPHQLMLAVFVVAVNEVGTCSSLGSKYAFAASDLRHHSNLSLSVVVSDGTKTRLSLRNSEVATYFQGRWDSVSNGLLVPSSVPVTVESGSDILGDFDYSEQLWDCGSNLGCLATAVRVYHRGNVVVASHTFPRGRNDTGLNSSNVVSSLFPCLSPEHPGETGYLTWFGEFAVTPAYRGGVWSSLDQKTRSATKYPGGFMGGTPTTFSLNNLRGPAVVVSPLDNFLSGIHVYHDGSGCLACGMHGFILDFPDGYEHPTIIVVGDSIAQVTLDWGELLLRYHNKKRTLPDANALINKIGYSGDGYYYYNPLSGNKSCGDYQGAYEAVGSYAASSGIPYGSFMLDSWWYGQGVYNGIFSWDENSPCYYSRFKDGVQQLWFDLGGLPWLAHMGTWLQNNTYRDRFEFLDDPLSVYCLPKDPKFWEWLIRRSANTWGLSVIKQDHMDQQLGCDWNHGRPICHSWPAVEDPFTAESWLVQQGLGASRNGVTIEYGTAFPATVLNSVKVQAVTYIRGANDYVPGHTDDAWRIGPASMLFWSLGLYTSKDTFFSSSSESPLTGEFASYHEKYPVLHALVSSLGGGPTSPSDGVNGSDVGLLLSLCTADGSLLKASRPAFPLDRFWLQVMFRGGPVDGDLWTTYTSVQPLMAHFVFSILHSEISLGLEEIAQAPGALSNFSIWAAFSPLTTKLETFALVDAKHPLKLRAARDLGDFSYVALTPLVFNGTAFWALLGETGKIIPISPQRIASVSISGNPVRTGFSITMRLVGAPGEVVVMKTVWLPGTNPEVWSGRPGAGMVEQHIVKVGTDGLATLHIRFS